ncbi:MAG: exodeoxyribonuclease VII large subunit [Anaerolineales bacterium]
MFQEPPNTTPQSITAITRRVRDLLENQRDLQDLWVEGEVSNYKRAPSGHLYFSLKDANAQLKCVMWKTDAAKLTFEPAHGDQIVAHGRISVYEVQGVYQFYADSLQPAGQGDLHRQFERLKAYLEADGLFESSRKQPLPAFPRCIGIVTSAKAAGLQDVLNILERRYPLAQVILSPTLVQGTAAPPQIVRAIDRLNRRDDIDVMLVIRGGGSLEDLWCFNDEAVVRAVAAARIPTVTGVGHEIDFTLVDFAADVRAPTPSAAAEIATPDQNELRAAVIYLAGRLDATVRTRITALQDVTDQHQRALGWLSPAKRLADLRQKLDEQAFRLNQAGHAHVNAQRHRLEHLQTRLYAASPQHIMARGYAMVTRAGDGKRMHSVQDAAPGTSVLVQMQDGTLKASVTERTYDDPE